MKKLMITLLAILLTVSGCGKKEPEKTPQELYEDIIETQQNVDYTRIDADIKQSITLGDITQDTPYSIKMDVSDPKDPRYHIIMKDVEDENGDYSDIEVIFVDGWLYMNMDGDKVKTQQGAEEILDQFDAESMVASQQYDPDMVKNLKTSKEGDLTVFEFDLDTEAVMEQVNETLGGLIDTEDASLNMTINKANVTAKYDSKTNVLKKTIVNIDFSMTFGSEKITMGLVTDLTVNAAGKDVKITAPADADSYVPIDDLQPGDDGENLD